MRSKALAVVLCVLLVLSGFGIAYARNPIRRDFFDVYPQAETTQLDDLPSNAGHCGACHFDFDGGGARNAYGADLEIRINGGMTNEQAILDVESEDSDGDGFDNVVEIADLANFDNTPAFPGLSSGNVGLVLNVNQGEVEPYLTPSGGSDTTPPDVSVSSPGGGEVLDANSYFPIAYTATDDSGVASVNIYLSDDSGATWRPVARNSTPGTGYSWFVPNRPGSANRIRVEAIDVVGNAGYDDSAGDFTITATPPGVVPTTFRDIDMFGTQPFEGAILDDPDANCATCHGNYDSAHEPWYNWRGSMMSQAARDPFFFACMAVAEQDAPSVGDVCIRCHSPGGWQEGRSVDTSGDLLNVKDRHGVQCDFCHRAVDHNYLPGVSPIEDLTVLATVDPLPLNYGNGQFINDPAPFMRGPYSDAQASHAVLESPFHRSSDVCGLCHDVSNPVFVRTGTHDYTPTAFDEQHPDMEIRNMAPVERTYSEWSRSEYASVGVFAPQFAGDKPDGIVSSCQDCHMRDVTGQGCNEPGAPTRTDLGLHDFTGGNTFVPDIIPMFFPDEVDIAQLQDAKARAVHMLELAATLEVTQEEFGVTVRVTNETGHRLPSGYPEGRRVWLHVEAVDALGAEVYESGEYDFETAELHHDEDAKIYEVHPGLSPGLAAALGMPAGPSFHFVLSDTVYSDNRIPPRGFTNAAFEEIQSAPVGYAYADGQYWDDTEYHLPIESDSVFVTLYYQSTSKEYVEFLRDANTTNSAGQDLYDAWVTQGKAPPVVMGHVRTAVDVTGSGVAEGETFKYELDQNFPNPFNPVTIVSYSIAEEGPVEIVVFDVSGRLVRTLVDEVREAGRYSVPWDGRNDAGQPLASGVYFVRYAAGGHSFWRKAALLR
jgi:mono/diheme cytochrome c family protein